MQTISIVLQEQEMRLKENVLANVDVLIDIRMSIIKASHILRLETARAHCALSRSTYSSCLMHGYNIRLRHKL